MRQHPFAKLSPTPATSFSLHCYAAVMRVVEALLATFDSAQAAFDHFPFVAGYMAELADAGLEGMALADAAQWWRGEVAAWEAAYTGHLPLVALKAAGLDEDALLLLLTIGLVEEDARFGPVFAWLQNRPDQQRPTLSWLDGWWRSTAGAAQSPRDGRGILRKLQAWGLVQPLHLDAPRADWTFDVSPLLWDALREDAPGEVTAAAPWLELRPHPTLTPLEQLIAPTPLLRQMATLPTLLGAGHLESVIVRGATHNGRRTLLGALAHSLGRGLLIVEGPTAADDPRWRGVGVLATLLGAMPVIVLELDPGETTHLPDLPGYHGPRGLVLGKHGGVTGPALVRAITLHVELPDGAARTQHWHAALQEIGLPHAPQVEINTATGAQLRMTSGNLRRTAKMAAAVAALEGRTTITLPDVRQASRSLNRQALETLATHLPPAQSTSGDAWCDLAVSAETQRDLEELELRCRFRESLHDAVGGAVTHQLNTGVRALMSGPSGTGKTLAARLLATALQMDLYRVDLATVVNKYIGETEKNLNQLFTRAEELDVILLLDEGDALLTQRTQVQSSNDRYANLETNYLLQRIEQFEGILLITTNAGDRIDRAFQRRMDVVIDFRAPDANERWAIWQLHLPASHRVDHTLLQEVAVRCILTGGQIRNAALHAALLALHADEPVGSEHVERAVQREYRKSGAVCPLRPMQGHAVSARAQSVMWS